MAFNNALCGKDSLDRKGIFTIDKDRFIKNKKDLIEYYTVEYRIQDARLGRFLSVDLLEAEYTRNSSYAFSENSIINSKDLEGAEKFECITIEVYEENSVDGEIVRTLKYTKVIFRLNKGKQTELEYKDIDPKSGKEITKIQPKEQGYLVWKKSKTLRMVGDKLTEVDDVGSETEHKRLRKLVENSFELIVARTVKQKYYVEATDITKNDKSILSNNGKYYNEYIGGINSLMGQLSSIPQKTISAGVLTETKATWGSMTATVFTATSVYFNNAKFNLINSDLNSIEFKSFSEQIDGIKKLGKIATESPKTQILVVGYTDNTGDNNLNYELSKNRCESVKKYLVDFCKISPDRIVIDPKGEKMADQTEKDSSDRRVDIVLKNP